MLLLEEKLHARIFGIRRLMAVPVVGQFRAGDLDLRIQRRGKCLHAFTDLFLEHAHQTVPVTRLPHATQRERNREPLLFREGTGVVLFQLVVAQMLPDPQLLPDQQINQSANEVRFARTVFGLHPKPLTLVVDHAVEDALEVAGECGGDAVFGNRLDGLFLLDDVGERRRGFRLRLDRDDFSQFAHKIQPS